MTGRWDEVGDGVFRRRYRELDQNIGLVVAGDQLLVIDSRSHPYHGRQLIEHVAEVSSFPIRWLVNTHWHWDHCFGNSVFPDAVIIGHESCRSGLIANGPLQLSRLNEADWFPESERPYLEEVSIVPPTLTFVDRTPLWVGERRLDLAHHGRGHTDADIVVTIDDVSFVGDLVEEGSPPAFSDSHPREWVATIRRMAPELRSSVVPGHGDVVDAAFAIAQAEEIEAAVGGEPVYPAEIMEQIRRRMQIDGV